MAEITELHDQGFLHIPSPFAPQQVNMALKTMSSDGVDYPHLRSWIDNVFMNVLAKRLTWHPEYLKFRISNVNNARDAFTFHGDLYDHRHGLQLLPVYTALVYFDDAELEVIPGSHLKQGNPFENLARRRRLPLRAGDVLVFHANLLHRGIFSLGQTNRRLLQVFDIFPNKTIARSLIRRILVVRTRSRPFMSVVDNVSEPLAKTPIVSDLIAFIHFFFVWYDLQYKVIFSDVSPKEGRVIGYVPGKMMSYDQLAKTNVDNWNINVNVDFNHEIVDVNDGGVDQLVLWIIIALVFAAVLKW